MRDKELRFIQRPLELRQDNNTSIIAGYAAVFNVPSEDLGGFVEIIKPNAFSKSLANGADVRCLFDHDSSKVLGRNKSGTLRLEEDQTGLFFECSLPDTTIAKDVAESVRRGDITGASFGFYVVNDTFERVGDITVRYLIEVDIFDVSVVTYPAYKDTKVSLRSYKEYQKQLDIQKLELLRRKVDLLCRNF